MAVRTYGAIMYDRRDKTWIITEAEPHVRIKLKNVFPKISVTAEPPYRFQDAPDISADLWWFMLRYPLSISVPDYNRLKRANKLNTERIAALETISLPDYVPADIVALKEPHHGRLYQLQAKEIFEKTRRMLLADELGLGKTLTSILCMFDERRLPAVVVVPTHLPHQWQVQGIEKFTGYKVHQIKGTRPYKLPPADVYILKYSCIAGWSSVFHKKIFRFAIFEECHELRTGPSSQKYQGCKVLSDSVDWVMGLSATPIYNYGGEIFWVLNLLKPGCLGEYGQFLREWTDCSNKPKVKDPAALGTYLRENFIMLRRTRSDVGKELPVVNSIVEWVEANEDRISEERDIARQLAMRVIDAEDFEEMGMAAREFDVRLRHMTGVAKAHSVAAVVKMLLEAGEPVVLAGWHRDVYDIWMKELAEYNPVLYTGSESPKQKQESFEAFTTGKTDLMIMSLRSGAGVEGLQNRCRYAVIGELDYSPKVHDQFIGRLNRDREEGTEQVTAMYVVTSFGADPIILDILGIKSSQSQGIVDPLKAIGDKFTDKSKFKEIARAFLAQEKMPGFKDRFLN